MGSELLIVVFLHDYIYYMVSVQTLVLHEGGFDNKRTTLFGKWNKIAWQAEFRADGSSSDSSQNNDSAKEPLKEPLKKKEKQKKTTGYTYTGPGGQPLSKDVINSLSQFTRKQRKGTIDVWWLYDDGGEILTYLAPKLLITMVTLYRSYHADPLHPEPEKDLRRMQITRVRPGKQEERIRTGPKKVSFLSQNTIMVFNESKIFRLAALLSKFRIEYCDVIVIPDITKKALESTKRDFENLIKPFKATETDGPGENRLQKLTTDF